MSRARRALPAVAIAAGLLGLAGSAGAHIAHGRPTLLSLVGGSEIVARVRVLDPSSVVTIATTGERRSVVRVELREVLKGPVEPSDSLQFASHGHGVAEYAAGDEALVFLVPLARTKELAALHGAGVSWASLQEHDARWILAAGSRDRVLGAARSYVAAEGLTDISERMAAVREVTLALLTSGDARLGASAIRDLVGSGELPLVTAAEVPRLLAEVVDAPSAPIGVRVGLLAELERRGLVDAPPRWRALLLTTPQPALLQVVRAAGRHPSAGVSSTLIEMLGKGDAVAEAAALALGDPAYASAVPALAGALERREPRVRMAAIRSLERIGTPAAQTALTTAAEKNADAATRRRAAAAVRKQTPRQ